eukprot:TRINITY_DN4336_c0_g1_i1.p1 TRINITY_DN4336_c0_g1~~TRINITY_DN4336_c0_g1_i1.p1  ORF type:complete len:152 (+),score=31.75 TRINITY_DN4336_c0_g1_i1:36-491(+)
MAERTIIRSLLILCCLTTAAAIRLQPKWTFQERVRSDHHRTLIAEVHDDVEQRLGPLPMFVAVEYRERTSPSAEWLMGRVQIDTNRWIDVRIIHVRNANKMWTRYERGSFCLEAIKHVTESNPLEVLQPMPGFECANAAEALAREELQDEL